MPVLRYNVNYTVKFMPVFIIILCHFVIKHKYSKQEIKTENIPSPCCIFIFSTMYKKQICVIQPIYLETDRFLRMK